jgi:hypothetical protein
MSNRTINASELDFETLKANLISYMQEQPGAFQDYNFEGSAMNTMIDVLSYITHINSVNANFALNETFLDTAQLRESVVSHAKLLGYTPRSTKPSVAVVDIEVISPINVQDDEGKYLPLSMSRGTIFTTTINSITHHLITELSHTSERDSEGKYIFKNVRLMQGQLNNRTYIYDETGFEHYVLQDNYVNTDTMIVEVYESQTTTQYDTFANIPNIIDIDNTSTAYFLEESRAGFYEIKFGDGIIGKRLTPGNIIKINYLTVGPEDINGASKFSLADTINGNSDVVITTVTDAVGGAPNESTESIKFNAPLGFVAQNRAVTPDDYKGIIQNSYGNVDTLTVWGGEDNIPPDYGKVYISIKPLDGEFLSDTQKAEIIGVHLKPKNVVSITPVLVVFYKYNPNISNATEAALSEQIRSVLTDYNNDNLKSFGGVFRNSNILQAIDSANIAVVSNTTRVNMHQLFTPVLGEERYYEFNFNQALTSLHGSINYMTSSEFTYNNEICLLKDYFNEEEAKRIIQVVNHNNKILSHTVGYIDELTGKIVLEGFSLDTVVGLTDQLKIITKPASNDISPMRNELLVINYNNAKIIGEIDTMVIGGTTAGIDYTTVSS